VLRDEAELPPRLQVTGAGISRQVLAVIVAGGTVVGSLSSCRDVVVGDRIDAAAGICALLQDCYGDQYSCEAIEADLRDASPEVRGQFLEGFDVESCLASCPGARACLDTAPFCAPNGSCEYDNDCCSWSTGEAACGEGPTAGKCCKPNGVACAEGDICCDAHCDKGLCGGYACKLVEEQCEKDTDCCTLFCLEQRCAIKSCSFLGETCETVADCCPVDFAVTEGVTLECLDQKCQVVGEPPCFLEGDMCTVAGNECCSDLGLSCISFDGQQGFCGDDSCPGFGQPCAADDTCCEGYVCDLSGLCLEALSCNDIGGPCAEPIDCCGALDCAESQCVEPGCNPTSCHDPCAVGPPMSGCNDDPGVADCVSMVVAADYWCGCFEWDGICVSAALEACEVCNGFD
jgi:hypothetical protein